MKFPNTPRHKQIVLRLTGRQYAQFSAHLFPGDGNEAVAVALCGRHSDENTEWLCVHQIEPIPHEECERTPDRLHWKTERLLPLLEKAEKKHLAILKIHSHPGGWPHFSQWDDESDGRLFPSIHGWTSDDAPHASAIMLPDINDASKGGRIFGRAVWPDGSYSQLDTVQVVGDDLRFWGCEEESDEQEAEQPEFVCRHAQLFGAKMTASLRRFSVAVVGCSGTGSPVIEQLARLGIGRLVLIDPDHVEEKNLNRIYNTRMSDARAGRLKVEVLGEAVRAMGLDCEVVTLATDLADADTVREVAGCDLVFGCMDGAFGRNLLNQICTFYLLPYFDMGVRLTVNEDGNIEHVCGSVNYIQPDGSTLMARRVFSQDNLNAEGLKRADPDAYQDQVRSKYITGVREDRPAVISVNTGIASLAVNEMLARLHPFRQEPNANFAQIGISLEQGAMWNRPESEFEQPDVRALRWVGRGEMMPFLNRTDLSDDLPEVPAQ